MTSKYGYLANLIKFRHDFGRFASSEEARTAPFPPGGANCAMLPPSSSPNRAHSVGPRFGLAASGRFFYPLRLVLASFVRGNSLHSVFRCSRKTSYPLLPSSSPNRAHFVGPRFGIAGFARLVILENLLSYSALRRKLRYSSRFFLFRKRSRSPKLSLVNAAFTLGLRFVLASSISSRLLAGSKARSFRCSSSQLQSLRFAVVGGLRPLCVNPSVTASPCHLPLHRGGFRVLPRLPCVVALRKYAVSKGSLVQRELAKIEDF